MKPALYMLILGVVCWWALIQAYPLEVKMGMTPHLIHQLPAYGFFVGLALGLGVAFSRGMRDIFTAILAMAVLGAVGWFLGVLFGGFLIIFGVQEPILSWMPRIGFVDGVLLGSVLLYAFAKDQFDTLRARLSRQ